MRTTLAFPDALMAAIAVRHEALLLTADRDFQRFPALKVGVLAEAS